MNLEDMLDDLGEDAAPAPKPAKPKGTTGSPQAAPTGWKQFAAKPPQFTPCVIFHPDCLTVRDDEIDLGNPRGQWWPTSHNTLVASTYVAHPDAKAALEACMEEIIMIRAQAIKAETKLLGKMFALARTSCVDLKPTEPTAATAEAALEDLA